MKQGAFTFVLHSHLPYCRRAGRWPHGEEWLHEALAETYLPLVLGLDGLRAEGVPFRLTIGMTPVLAEQLSDALVVEHFRAYSQERQDRAAEDAVRLRRSGDEDRARLADFYGEWYQRNLDGFNNRFGGDIVGALRRLQDDGCVEVTTSAATHGYLPLLSRDSSIRAQVGVGVQSYRRHFGRKPTAIWLPECAYRPAFWAGSSHRRPGLEEFLAPEGIGLFFAETHAVEGGAPVGKALDGVVGPYGAIPQRFLVPIPEYTEPVSRTTDLPYRVGQSVVSVIGRNNRTGMQVWSADWGYPGDGAYREFHKKDGNSGLQYWRVTGPRLDLAAKALYDPDAAAIRAEQHARHFAKLVEDLVAASVAEGRTYPIISSNYDTELFGHWWFEGVDWILQVLRLLSSSHTVELVTASGYLSDHPARQALALPEGSWGSGGTHFTWDNVETHWMWPQIHAAEALMESLAARHPQADEPTSHVLNQAARELLLLQSSDWPFLVSTGQAAQYAVERFLGHLERLERMARHVENGPASEEAARDADELYEIDRLFPEIDYRVFAPQSE